MIIRGRGLKKKKGRAEGDNEAVGVERTGSNAMKESRRRDSQIITRLAY